MTDKLTGLHDWRVRIPLVTGDPDRPDFDMLVRVPAVTRSAAAELAAPIALHIAETTNTTVTLADLDPVDVDHLPSDDELLHRLVEREQEVTHWRKVVAGLAAKFPLILHLTKDEYDKAVGDDIAAMPAPGGDGFVFMVPSTFGAMMDARAQQHEPVLLPAYDLARGEELEKHVGRQILLNGIWQPIDTVTPDFGGDFPGVRIGNDVPAGGGIAQLVPEYSVRDTQPELDGGEEDPDVRRLRAVNAGIFGENNIMVLDGGRWRPLARAEIRTNGTVVMFLDAKKPVIVDRLDLVTVRPTSWVADGAQLITDNAVGRQALVDGQWREILAGARKHEQGPWYQVPTPGRDIPVDRDGLFQVRDVPERWT